MLELTLDTNLENIAVVGGGLQESKDMVLGTGVFQDFAKLSANFFGRF
jgi:hypothetical protein